MGLYTVHYHRHHYCWAHGLINLAKAAAAIGIAFARISWWMLLGMAWGCTVIMCLAWAAYIRIPGLNLSQHIGKPSAQFKRFSDRMKRVRK